MLVASDDYIVVIPYGYLVSAVSLTTTQEANGVQCHFKLGACPYERAAHWLHLHSATSDKEPSCSGQYYYGMPYIVGASEPMDAVHAVSAARAFSLQHAAIDQRFRLFTCINGPVSSPPPPPLLVP